MKGRRDFYMNYLDIYSLNETTRISAQQRHSSLFMHCVIRKVEFQWISQRKDKNGWEASRDGYLRDRTGGSWRGWCELAEDQKQTELVTEYWSRIWPEHFLVWFPPPQPSAAVAGPVVVCGAPGPGWALGRDHGHHSRMVTTHPAPPTPPAPHTVSGAGTHAGLENRNAAHCIHHNSSISFIRKDENISITVQ